MTIFKWFLLLIIWLFVFVIDCVLLYNTIFGEFCKRFKLKRIILFILFCLVTSFLSIMLLFQIFTGILVFI